MVSHMEACTGWDRRTEIGDGGYTLAARGEPEEEVTGICWARFKKKVPSRTSSNTLTAQQQWSWGIFYHAGSAAVSQV